MNKILWLASWYPNKTSLLNGDFIQRHAEATSIYHPVQVVFVVKDKNISSSNRVLIEKFTRGNLSETIVYYKPVRTGIPPIDKIISILTYLNILKKQVTEFAKINGRPKLVHVHVAMWAGVIAVWLKRKWKTPYFVSEHWTGYHKNAIENIHNKGLFFKYLSKAILENADLLLPDSHELGQYINDHLLPARFLYVPNVVDTNYFNASFLSDHKFSFIHVSAMGPQKNVGGILRAFAKLIILQPNCNLTMAGPAPVTIIEEAGHLGLTDHVNLLGAITYPEVAARMKSASALIMFSEYENQPCVILEALCSGLPVISTNVGGIAEVIDSSNGILVGAANEQQLLQAMLQMIENYGSYEREKISNAAAEKYNYTTIGRQIADLYHPYNL